MSLFPAVLDTCVLYPYYLADTLLTLADAETYRPLWSKDILAELRDNLVTSAGLDERAVDRRIEAMRTAFPDATVTGHEPLIPVMPNQQKDRHVLAAAVRARAEVIVTANIKDFPPDALQRFDLTAVHPDRFLLDQLDLYPRVVIGCLQRQAEIKTHEPRTVGQLAARLARCGVPDFAAEVLRY